MALSRTDEILERSGNYLSESMQPRTSLGSLGGGSFSTPGEMQGRKKLASAFAIELDRIVPDPNQPRKTFEKEALEQLAHSLKTKGQLMPVRVRWDVAADRYVIIAGERRYQAAKLAKLATLDCVVHEKALSEDELLEVQLIENCVRQDLNPIEQALALKNLMEKKRWSQGDVAESLRMGRTSVLASLSLLKLPEDIQDQVSSGTLPPSVAREIVKLKDESEQRAMVARYLDGMVTSNDAAKSAKAKKEGKKVSTQSKKLARTWSDGQKLTLHTKRKESNVQIAQRLKDWADALLADGRSSKAA